MVCRYTAILLANKQASESSKKRGDGPKTMEFARAVFVLCREANRCTAVVLSFRVALLVWHSKFFCCCMFIIDALEKELIQ